MKTIVLACCVSAICLTGCASIPTSGPTASQVLEQAAKEPRHFDIIELNDRTIATLASQPSVNLGGFESYGKPPNPTIAVGDIVSVSIWQASIQRQMPE